MELGPRFQKMGMIDMEGLEEEVPEESEVDVVVFTMDLEMSMVILCRHRVL